MDSFEDWGLGRGGRLECCDVAKAQRRLRQLGRAGKTDCQQLADRALR